MKLTSGALFEHTNCLLNRRNRYQFLATFLVNISTFAHGIGIGWMSPVMRQLQTPESPLSFGVFVEELSWIGSLLGIGSVIGNLLAGFLQDRIGRKPVMFALTVPYVCFWLLSYFAQSVQYLYLARLLAGITGGGGYIVFPIFISEISDANMCTIVIGAVQIVGTYTTTLICDQFGRKILLLISTLGAGICLAAFGCFTYFAKLYDLSALGWLPLVLLSLDVFLCNIGLVGVFFVVLVEVMPAKIRSVAVSTFVVILSCTVFVSLKIFPLCMQYWGISITLWSSSLVAFVSFVYFLLFLDETKGKSLLDS
ncbi:facilitated trehalose transporter Tret1 isoform X2 [Drosophila montana]|uniref:facilitated trehalose transporter Tret1 isoform X2 n=1 Tax=Drosophila montana TaxID=40370 RepID=UPI00313C1DF6